MTPKNKPIFKTLAVFCAALFFQGAIAAAQEISNDSLLVDYSNCMTGCLDYEGELGCEVLCGCTVERFKSELDQDQYIALFDQLSQNEVSPENRAFLDETANLCVAEMDRLLAEFGLDSPPDLSALPPPQDEDDAGEGGGE